MEKRLLFSPLLFILFSCASQAGFFDEAFIDPSDGQLDMSHWLLEKKGLLPVPIIITEPAVGYGGGLAAVYFHDKMGAGKGGAPSVSALTAAGTENGTRFIGGGHMGIWNDDHIRYTGGLGTALVKMQYYGLPKIDEDKGSLEFETKALFLIQKLQFRLGDSPFFAGLSYTFADTQNTFQLKSSEPIFGLPGISFDSRSAALGLMLNYDSRDNLFTPSQGMAAELQLLNFNELWASDQNFNKLKGSVLSYNKLNQQVVLGLRVDAQSVAGNAPFYSYPYINMRGVKAMQFQGEQTLLGEAEVRWAFTARWSLVVFGGAGKAYNDNRKGDSELIYSKGLGGRYLIASQLGLQMGLDVAKGPDDSAVYIQVGSAWAIN